LCVDCIEARLGRRLAPHDFTAAPINDPSHPWMSARLAGRMAGLMTDDTRMKRPPRGPSTSAATGRPKGLNISWPRE
jgi:hypothetical protein